jgi:hypothetical protein
MGLFSQWELKDSIEIETTPEKIWDFFINLEDNYKSWHPEDHVVFKWTKGKPMQLGSHFYAEEIMGGKVVKIKGFACEVVPNRKIFFKYSFPLSILAPGTGSLIETIGSSSVFTAISYIRAGDLLSKISKKELDKSIVNHKKHVKEEGENLKAILES